MELYIGLMSGTSVDGIDAVLVDFSNEQARVIGNLYKTYTQELREKILALCEPGHNEIERLGELDVLLGKAFAATVHELLHQHQLSSETIRAIGSHGQTIRHQPHQPHRFTLQIGDPSTIAAETGITTVADFRRRDIAHGGQGAPLVPAFHQHMFFDEKNDRAIVNIGGIANVTLLTKKNEVLGFDTGPGNILLDALIGHHQQKQQDHQGIWAKTGKMQNDLLDLLLSDPYFKKAAPKSTGREYFNLAWLNHYLQTSKKQYAPQDVQATLVELTACTILSAIKKQMQHGEILVCGGGIHNHFLQERLYELAQPHFMIASTEKYGIDPDWVEAIAFAWLAKQTIQKQPGNLPSVTGADKKAILGGIYYS